MTTPQIAAMVVGLAGAVQLLRYLWLVFAGAKAAGDAIAQSPESLRETHIRHWILRASYSIGCGAAAFAFAGLLQEGYLTDEWQSLFCGTLMALGVGLGGSVVTGVSLKMVAGRHFGLYTVPSMDRATLVTFSPPPWRLHFHPVHYVAGALAAIAGLIALAAMAGAAVPDWLSSFTAPLLAIAVTTALLGSTWMTAKQHVVTLEDLRALVAGGSASTLRVTCESGLLERITGAGSVTVRDHCGDVLMQVDAAAPETVADALRLLLAQLAEEPETAPQTRCVESDDSSKT